MNEISIITPELRAAMRFGLPLHSYRETITEDRVRNYCKIFGDYNTTDFVPSSFICCLYAREAVIPYVQYKWDNPPDPTNTDLSEAQRHQAEFIQAILSIPYRQISAVDLGDGFEYLRPLKIGETLECQFGFCDLDEKQARSGRLLLLKREYRFSDRDGNLVARAWNTNMRCFSVPKTNESQDS